jgi:hypothetical protein
MGQKWSYLGEDGIEFIRANDVYDLKGLSHTVSISNLSKYSTVHKEEIRQIFISSKGVEFSGEFYDDCLKRVYIPNSKLAASKIRCVKFSSFWALNPSYLSIISQPALKWSRGS